MTVDGQAAHAIDHEVPEDGMAATSTTTHPITLSDRLGALSGAAYVLLILVGNQIATGGSQDPHPTGAQDLADFAASRPPSRVIGETMEFLGFLAFMFFVGWLTQALRHRGGAAAWLANTAAIAGTTVLAVKIASILPMAAGMLDHAEMSPATARVLADMNGAGFVITFLPFGVFLVAGGAAILSSGLLGRVAGWFAVAIGGVCVALTLATGVNPVETNPMPFLAGLLWMLVISVRLAAKGPRSAMVRDAAQPLAPAPASA